MAALGHTSTPFCFLIRQLLGFFPGQVHLSEVSFDDIYPVLPWSSWLSLVTFQFPVCCLTSCSRVVHKNEVLITKLKWWKCCWNEFTCSMKEWDMEREFNYWLKSHLHSSSERSQMADCGLLYTVLCNITLCMPVVINVFVLAAELIAHGRRLWGHLLVSPPGGAAVTQPPVCLWSGLVLALLPLSCQRGGGVCLTGLDWQQGVFCVLDCEILTPLMHIDYYLLQTVILI